MFKLLNTDTKAYLFITLVASLLFIPFIGNMPLFDWDEINFAECAREMIVSGDYSNVQIYFQPFWEKPPLFIWLQAISMNLFGVNEFAARFPNAICGVVTLLVLYKTGKTLNDNRFGLLWAFVYAATLLPHLFFKSGIIDPWFNLLIFLSVFQLLQHTNNPVGAFGYKTAALAGFFLGLALLTKGPAALILVGLTVTVFFIVSRFKKISEFKFVALFFATFLVTGLSWFIVELIKGNAYIIKEFIDYQIRLFNTEDSDHGGPFIYHFVVLLLGCFPSSLFLIIAHKKSDLDTPFQKHSKLWMLCLFWVVLILFSIVKTKIVHYSSLCYFPLTYLATYGIRKLMSGEYAWRKWLHLSFVIISTLIGLVFVIFGCLPILKPWLLSSNVIADKFAVENLKADVKWSGLEWLIGIVFLGIAHFSLAKIKTGAYKFIYLLFFGSLFSVYSLIMVVAPKVEQYTQHAAIEFYKMCARQNYYVETISFKSYANMFYGDLPNTLKDNKEFIAYKEWHDNDLKQKGVNTNTYFSLFYRHWLEEGIIDRPACFVAKCTEPDLAKRYPTLTELYRQNGFIFLMRIPEQKKQGN